MDNRYNEIRHEVGIVRAAMLETEASIRDQISVCTLRVDLSQRQFRGDRYWREADVPQKIALSRPPTVSVLLRSWKSAYIFQVKKKNRSGRR